MGKIHFGVEMFEGKAFCGSPDGPFTTDIDADDIPNIESIAAQFTAIGTPMEVCEECAVHLRLITALRTLVSAAPDTAPCQWCGMSREDH